MKYFITYDIKSELNQGDVFNEASRILPDFEWRKGNSDSQGEYISGINKSKVDIQLWLSASLIEMSVSFRSVRGNLDKKSEEKQELTSFIEANFIPVVGLKIKQDEFV